MLQTLQRLENISLPQRHNGIGANGSNVSSGTIPSSMATLLVVAAWSPWDMSELEGKGLQRAIAIRQAMLAAVMPCIVDKEV